MPESSPAGEGAEVRPSGRAEDWPLGILLVPGSAIKVGMTAKLAC